MSNYDADSSKRSVHNKDLAETRLAADEAVSQLRELRDRGEMSLDDKLRAVHRVQRLRDRLLQKRGEGVFHPKWEDRRVDVDLLARLEGRTVTVEKTLDRRGSPTEERPVPALSQVSVDDIVRIKEELVRMANDAGHSFDVSVERPVVDADPV